MARDLGSYQRAEVMAALATVGMDPAVGIRHAPLDGDESYRNHAAGIQPGKRVAAHTHFVGDEEYVVYAGRGIMHAGSVEDRGKHYSIDWHNRPLAAGDRFIVPAGHAHQLENNGSEELVFTFGCPDSHLSSDRVMLPDYPIDRAKK